MFYDNELLFLQKMLKKCHLQNLLINPEEPLDERVDNGLRKLYRPSAMAQSFYDYIPDVRPATVYRMTDVFLCRYIFMELPFCEQPTILLIGPYLNNHFSRQQVLELAEQRGFPPRSAQGLELFYGSLPVVREEHHLFAMVNTFAEYVFNGEGNYDSVDLHSEHDGAFLNNLSPPKGSPETEAMDMEMMERRYQFENALIDAVAQGNTHKAEQMMAGFSNMSFENRTADQLRNMKNYCIIMNTLMRKAAEKGRVHPIYLDRVSSDFAHRIESLRSLTGIMDFMSEILRTYCRLVKRHSMHRYSPLVQKTMIFIEGDLTSDLSLRAVAQKNNVSPGYLSGLFKKETGKTFTAYVNSRRIELAKHLLRTTTLQVQTIAQHCGVLDFHYFCRLFKNAVGKTPTEYRNAYPLV